MKKGKHREAIYSRGLVMHTCFAITTQGTPLGLLDQKIFARESRPDHERRCKGGNQDRIAVEQKESYRWIQTLETTSNITSETRIVTGSAISTIFLMRQIRTVQRFLYGQLRTESSTEKAVILKKRSKNCGAFLHRKR